jgi:hypothetical protein
MELKTELLSYFDTVRTQDVTRDKHKPSNLILLISVASMKDMMDLEPVHISLEDFLKNMDTQETRIDPNVVVSLLSSIKQQATTDAYRVFYSILYIYASLRLDNIPYQDCQASKCRLCMAMIATPTSLNTPISCSLL